jgi:hypothetical protein
MNHRMTSSVKTKRFLGVVGYHVGLIAIMSMTALSSRYPKVASSNLAGSIRFLGVSAGCKAAHWFFWTNEGASKRA